MNIYEVDQPEDWGKPKNWYDVLVPLMVSSTPTFRTLDDFLPDDGRRFHDMGDFDERHDDERTVSQTVGVGDEPGYDTER